MKVIRKIVQCTLTLMPILLVCAAQQCQRVYTKTGPDCRTMNDEICTPESSTISMSSLNDVPKNKLVYFFNECLQLYINN